MQLPNELVFEGIPLNSECIAVLARWQHIEGRRYDRQWVSDALETLVREMLLTKRREVELYDDIKGIAHCKWWYELTEKGHKVVDQIRVLYEMGAFDNAEKARR